MAQNPPEGFRSTYLAYICQAKYYLDNILCKCSHRSAARLNAELQRLCNPGGKHMNSYHPLSSTAMAYGRRPWIAAAAAALGGMAINATVVRGADSDGVSRTAEAIHQEPVLKASAKRIYEALTDAQQFQKVTMLSGDAQGADFATKPAVLSRELGSAFSLFGGYVTGRQIDLVPDQRLVQAWRAGSWAVGVYSIARFELVADGAGTKIVFDHTGFPQGTAEHLAAGWKSHYWEGLEKFLA
jgi:uncharacterized protein YndB with AHSA1/START domain